MVTSLLKWWVCHLATATLSQAVLPQEMGFALQWLLYKRNIMCNPKTKPGPSEGVGEEAGEYLAPGN